MKPRESIPAPLRLNLSGPTAIHDATSAARAFAEKAEVDDNDVARLVILVEELVANLYDHSGLDASDSFEIWLSVRQEDMIFLLIAPGAQFDPRDAVLLPETPSRGGGAGLRLLQAWSGQIDYQYADGQNHVALLLPFALN